MKAWNLIEAHLWKLNFQLLAFCYPWDVTLPPQQAYLSNLFGIKHINVDFVGPLIEQTEHCASFSREKEFLFTVHLAAYFPFSGFVDGIAINLQPGPYPPVAAA